MGTVALRGSMLMLARLVLAVGIVGAAVAAFSRWGPLPGRAADGALARQLLAAERKQLAGDPTAPRSALALIKDGAQNCPKTSAASMLRTSAADVRARCEFTAAGLALIAQDGAVLAAVPPPTALSLLGPFTAVALVLLLRQAALGLLLAVFAGAIAMHGPWGGLQHGVVEVLWPTVSDADNLLIIGFTLAMLGMVHVGMAGGGFAHLARRIASGVQGGGALAARRARVATVLLGLAIFFDDYANALVVGTSMRPLADRTGVSRAKLAFLVDATSASVAGIALVSTWVGFEIGLLGEQARHFDAVATSPYGVFLAALPYRFYCIFVIVFAALLAWTGRDFGPMRQHEQEAAARLAQTPVGDSAGAHGRGHWLDAMAPVGIVLLTVIAGDLWFGRHAEGGPLARFVAGAEAAGLQVLCAGAGLGSLVAISGATLRRLLSLWAAMRAWLSGVLKMWQVVVILASAMAMRVITEQAGTQDYLAALLGDAAGPWMPLISFVTAGVIAFLTGSSWATMGILLPIVIPLAAVAPGAGEQPSGWLLAAAAAVLDGAIFGDHCSPISDTTVMSSAATGCPHDVHVLTQLPYAVTAMLVAAGVGYVGTALLSWPAWSAWLPGVMLLVVITWGLGRPVQHAAAGPSPTA